ncbi:MAG: hypothetical protein IGQ88_10895 [Gloeomargaritaceae cyanobacterium C42_A2020_066]|nr:hypothetical protein [Gloeomargaritaceae cyanobacterium C42_A2020_066]
MTDTDIAYAIALALAEDSLKVQVTQAPPYLYVVLDRTGDHPDYDRVTAITRTVIKGLKPPDIQAVAIYSRPLGATDPDWETYFYTITPAPPPRTATRP